MLILEQYLLSRSMFLCDGAPQVQSGWRGRSAAPLQSPGHQGISLPCCALQRGPFFIITVGFWDGTILLLIIRSICTMLEYIGKGLLEANLPNTVCCEKKFLKYPIFGFFSCKLFILSCFYPENL